MDWRKFHKWYGNVQLFSWSQILFISVLIVRLLPMVPFFYYIIIKNNIFLNLQRQLPKPVLFLRKSPTPSVSRGMLQWEHPSATAACLGESRCRDGEGTYCAGRSYENLNWSKGRNGGSVKKGMECEEEGESKGGREVWLWWRCWGVTGDEQWVAGRLIAMPWLDNFASEVNRSLQAKLVLTPFCRVTHPLDESGCTCQPEQILDTVKESQGREMNHLHLYPSTFILMRLLSCQYCKCHTAICLHHSLPPPLQGRHSGEQWKLLPG